MVESGGLAAISGQCRWYAVHTLPHKEELAELNLKRQGFTTFTPRAVKSVRHARQFRVQGARLLPALFVHCARCQAADVALGLWDDWGYNVGYLRRAADALCRSALSSASSSSPMNEAS